jgi:holo-[acyl-carrier protein] synthase
MISGLGTDVVAIDRIRKMLERHGENILNRIYTEAEQAEAAARNHPTEYYAGRWCAKEALSKALKCGIGEHCSWLDISILNGASGAPELELSGTARATAERMGCKRIHVSISHEREYASATVIIES